MTLPATALTTLTTVKSELNLSVSTDDTYLERLINTADAFVETFCKRRFYYETAIVEKIDGFGMPYIALARAPIVSITSVTYDGGAVSSADYEIRTAEAGIVYYKGAWIWTAQGGAGITHLPKGGTERKLYTFTYTAGFITPGQDNGSSLIRNLPYDLEDAVIQLVTYRYRQRGRDQALMSESLLNASVSYKQPFVISKSLKTLLPNVYDILRAYTFEPML